MQTEKGEVVNSRRIDVGLKVIHAYRPCAVLHGIVNYSSRCNLVQQFYASMYNLIHKLRGLWCYHLQAAAELETENWPKWWKDIIMTLNCISALSRLFECAIKQRTAKRNRVILGAIFALVTNCKFISGKSPMSSSSLITYMFASPWSKTAELQELFIANSITVDVILVCTI